MQDLINSVTKNGDTLVEYAVSHGATEYPGALDSNYQWLQSYLGAGLIYYTLAYTFLAEVCVCIGSGGGLVPSMMRQAQRDINFPLSANDVTILIDADLAQSYGDHSNTHWIRQPDHIFNINYPEVVRLVKLSKEAVKDINRPIDYLHIDGDHSYAGVKLDFDLYSKLLSANGIITLHDSSNQTYGVSQLIQELRLADSYDIMELPPLRYYQEFDGLTILRMRG